MSNHQSQSQSQSTLQPNYQHNHQLTLTYFQQIFDKIRTLCKQCNLSNLPIKINNNDLYYFCNNSNNSSNSNNNLQINQNSNCSTNNFIGNNNNNYWMGNNNIHTNIISYITALDQLRTKIYQFHELQQQYKKLQSMLQRNQTQIRKHIGIEQQFKLYIDTLKGQFQQSQNSRLELLDNSKIMIKQLKAENQVLRDKIKGVIQDKDSKIKDWDKDREKEKDCRIIGINGSSKQSRKNISRNKDKLRNQNFSSLHINHSRHHTQNTYISPAKQQIKPHDFRIELTQRLQSSKKKRLTEIKRKQNYTIMAYIGNKKRQSRDRNQIKKALLSVDSKKKKINLDNFVKQSKDKQKHNLSDKKVYKSMFSLESIDSAQE